MNPYLKNLTKIEFVVTDACTGRCKHCSEGEHALCGERISPEVAAQAVREIAAAYPIRTVMAFGGEPLLYADTVDAIMACASALGIPHRQVITNGYFTRDAAKMREALQQLSASGVNDLLVSVDAFHQEYIPLGAVREFVLLAKAYGIPVRLQPAWLVSRDDDNPYNEKTRELLATFCDTGIAVSEGNIVFPEGNARVYLKEYLEKAPVDNPYVENPYDVRTVSFSANGDVLSHNVYRESMHAILEAYQPK